MSVKETLGLIHHIHYFLGLAEVPLLVTAHRSATPDEPMIETLPFSVSEQFSESNIPAISCAGT